ncbi:hypothetical protein [Spirosoma rigui]|uniref:hypothetical protein n=1 Tax=Spirosoma rigui TaxID=564064 RepID=UPI0009B11FB8|nr:hypothetical protein [Spirosoma rigui]
MSKGAPQPTVRDTADDTKGYELDTNLPDEAQGKTARGKHKSKQSTEDEHNATGSVENSDKGGHGHSGHSKSQSGSESNAEQ